MSNSALVFTGVAALHGLVLLKPEHSNFGEFQVIIGGNKGASFLRNQHFQLLYI